MSKRWDIVSNNILCHVVGLNTCAKKRFMEELYRVPHLVVRDIDQITHHIRNTPYFIQLYKKIKQSSTSSERKELNRQLYEYWKKSLHEKLYNILSRHRNEKVVLMGLSTFHKDHRVRVCIQTGGKFFVRADHKGSAKELVGHNLDEYRQYIINGSFPLKFIDTNFLAQQRERLQRIYGNMGYQLTDCDMICKNINASCERDNSQCRLVSVPSHHQKEHDGGSNGPNLRQNNQSSLIPDKHWKHGGNSNGPNLQNQSSLIPDKHWKPSSYQSQPLAVPDKRWYSGSSTKYTDYITPVKRGGRRDRHLSFIKAILNDKIVDELVSYDQPWLASLLSIPNNKHIIEKGFQKRSDGRVVPYVKELFKDAFDELRTFCYLYLLDWAETSQKSHRTTFTEPVKIKKMVEIPNVYEYLRRNGIMMISYGNKIVE